MKLESGMLGGRLTRRLFAVFFLSAVAPVLTLSLISFNRVSDQLVIQNQEQLEQEAKATGLGIFERLTLLEAEMQLVDTQFSEVENASASVLAVAQRDRMDEKFKTLGWVNNVGTYAPFLEPADRLVSPDIYDRPLQGTGDTVIYSTQDANEVWHIFMVYVAEQTVSEDKVLIAEIYPDYLWSIETLDLSRGVCVLSQANEVLFCSETVPLALPEYARQFTANSFAGSTEWGETEEPTHLVSYWSIFLGSNFDAQDWTSLISFPRQDVLSPVTNFQNTFLIIIVITVLVVFMLSSTQIRRILTPLSKLAAGIQQIGDSNFDSRVDIDDEFPDLADSFNTMGAKLADQFYSLQTVAEIDRLILSSQDASNIVQAVLVRINEIIECDQIGIFAQNSEGHFETMYSMTHKSPEITETAIELARNDIDLLRGNKLGLAISKNQGAPDFLRPLITEGANTCLIVPLLIEEELTAVVTLGYYEQPAHPDNLLDETRGWADRIAVALSNARWQEKLYQQANYDSLTGLPNQPALKTYLQQALDRAERNDEMVGVLCIDLDRFKLVNDSLGHAAGDEYLQVIGERLSECIRSTDMLARLGGDEFTIVLSDSPNYHHLRNSIAAVADKLLELVPQPTKLETHEISVSASIGISIYPLDANNIDDLMKNADSAMYHAKANGGGSYHYFSEELNKAITEQLRVENELKAAIKKHELELYFQPQIDASTGELLGAETLIRWNHPEEGMIPPYKFIPLAEQSQLIVEVDLWVLHAAGAHLKTWRHQKMKDVRLAVNLSAYFFKQEDVIQILLDLVKHHQIEPRHIELEITEGTLVEDIEGAIDVLGKLKDLGFRSTIDDFGTGYSSLSYLKQLPVYKLKIDQSFVTKCDTDPVDKSLVETIINMARSLNLKCIAEGVETEQQLNFLLENGCNEIQGYYFSKPLWAKDFADQYLTVDQATEELPNSIAS